MITQRHPNVADGTRPKHGALVRREYGLLAPEYVLLEPEDPAGDPANTGPQGSRDSPEDTTRIGDTDRRGTGTREQNGQRAPLAHGQLEYEEEKRGLPERKRALNT